MIKFHPKNYTSKTSKNLNPNGYFNTVRLKLKLP